MDYLIGLQSVIINYIIALQAVIMDYIIALQAAIIDYLIALQAVIMKTIELIHRCRATLANLTLILILQYLCIISLTIH